MPSSVVDRVCEHSATELGIGRRIDGADARQTQPDRQGIQTCVQQCGDDIVTSHAQGQKSGRPLLPRRIELGPAFRLTGDGSTEKLCRLEELSGGEAGVRKGVKGWGTYT